jgi:hypothetical protein
MAEYPVQRPGLLVPCSTFIKALKMETHKEDILVFEMQMYVTVQFSIFTSDFFCCHTFDTGKCTEECKIYKCMLCLKIVSLSYRHVCVCSGTPLCLENSISFVFWQVWTEITEDGHAKLCIFIEQIVFRCLFQR